MLRRLRNPKKSPTPVAKASKDKSGKKHMASATRKKHQPRFLTQNWQTTSRKIKQTLLRRKKNRRHQSPKQRRQRKSRPATITNRRTHRNPPTLVRQSQNLTTKRRQRQRPTPRETPEPSASQNQSGITRLHPNRNPRRKKPRKFQVKRRRRGNPNRREKKRKHQNRKKRRRPVRKSALQDQSGQHQPRKVSRLRHRRQSPSLQSKVPRAGPAGERAQVVIEKSGLEEDQGLEPPPSPPPKRGFWPWSRSSGNYRYLTRSVIEAIRRAPVKRRRWQFIVVHNSGTRQGNARVFDYYHRHVRRMQNGLAYHFVIGNGTSTGNGQVEVGDRWRRQINGGHVHSDYLNNISLGICLVGDFNRGQPTRAQLDSCEELIRYLRERCGKTDRGTIPVRPHREMNPPRWPTDCPGDDFPYSWFRRF